MNLLELIQKAEKAYRAHEFDEAIVFYKKAIDLDLKNARLYSEIGISYYHLNDKKNALLNLDIAVDLEPNSSYRYSSRGYIKGGLKMLGEAILDYEKAIELDPLDSITFNNLGLLQEQKGWAKMAESNFDKADSLEGILKGRKIALPNSEEKSSSMTSIEKEKVSVSQKQNEVTKSAVMKDVFTKKDVFKEFIGFVKNGFKLKER